MSKPFRARAGRRRLPGLALLAAGIGFTSAAPAAVSVAALFADHAVLQQSQAAPVWGTAAPGEKITISFRDQTVSTSASPEGKWLAHLDTSRLGDPAELVIAGENTLRFHDIVVGEVWLCSGQSNMQLPLIEAADGVSEAAAADYPLIRQFKVATATARQPAEAIQGEWIPCAPSTAESFTAVGYFFAREIHGRHGVPVGIVNASVGGTAIESWMSPASLVSNTAFAPVASRWAATIAGYPERKAAYDQALAWWENASGKERVAAARKGIRKPTPPKSPTHRDAPGSLFNGMIHPLIPYRLRGILWYQGEANASRAGEYAALFRTLITDWRQRWGREDLPFLFVQLANFETGPGPGATWALLREAQAQALTLPHTGMAVAVDLGEPDNIHPRNKQEVGRRLALLAREHAYGEATHSRGPAFRGIERQGASLRIRFEPVEGGLVARESGLREFEIAGDDRRFHPADAKIEGEAIVVSHPDLSTPVAVRYAWRDNPTVSLFDGAGLPAAPFRSDTW